MGGRSSCSCCWGALLARQREEALPIVHTICSVELARRGRILEEIILNPFHLKSAVNLIAVHKTFKIGILKRNIKTCNESFNYKNVVDD